MYYTKLRDMFKILWKDFKFTYDVIAATFKWLTAQLKTSTFWECNQIPKLKLVIHKK